jgi:uncharacterized membrane protein
MIRTTLIGGAIFLIPVVFVIYILAKASEISSGVAHAIARVAPVDGLAGVLLADALAVLLILAVCYAAGLAARCAFFARHVQRVEALLVEFFPGFTIAKSMASGMAGVDDRASLLRTVLVAFDDHEAIGFEVERTAARVIVFLPGAPSAWSGQSVAVPPGRVTALDLPVHKVSKLMRTLGRGAAAALNERAIAAPADTPTGPRTDVQTGSRTGPGPRASIRRRRAPSGAVCAGWPDRKARCHGNHAPRPEPGRQGSARCG